MTYRHPAARIHEIVKAPKALVAGQSVSPEKGRTGSFFINTVAKTIRSQTLYLVLEHEASAYPV